MSESVEKVNSFLVISCKGLLLQVQEKGSDIAGFLAEVTVAVEPDALPDPVGMHGGPLPFSI